MKKLFPILFLFPFQIWAHLGSLSGVITEKGTGNKMIGTTISIVGTNKVTTTNELGQYNFKNLIASNYKLEIRNIGYKTLRARFAGT